MSNISVGSVWRKWDLHIHAPTSVFANQFEGKDDSEKWEKYITALESLSDIAVLGITDYWSVDGYKKVKQYKESGRLQNVELILPNVELRLSTYTPAGNAINFHCVFNPDLIDDLDSRFFSKLTFQHGIPYVCNRSDLIKLGRKHKNNSSLDEQSAYAEGCNQFKVAHTELIELFQKDPDLRKNTFLIVPNSSNDGNSGIQDDNYEATRQIIYRLVDGIFTANPKSIKYFLGMGTDSIEEVIRKYGRLKPCLHGSDAHSNEKLCVPDKDRFTWIKAECTFEGLKQVIYEPEERAKIGAFKPDTKNTYQTIQSLKVISDDFIDKEIPVNRNLCSIIGGKSTGKSLLLYHLALTADSEEVQARFKEMSRPLLYQQMDRPFDLIITWADNSQSILSSREEVKLAHKITYIPQSYLNFIADRQKDTVDKIIEKLLLQNDETKEAYEIFEKQKQSENLNLTIRISEFFSNLTKWRTLKEEAKALGNKDGVVSFIEKLQKEIQEISARFGFTPEELAKKEALETDYMNLTAKINYLTSDEVSLNFLASGVEEYADFSQLMEVTSHLREPRRGVIEAETKSAIDAVIEKFKNIYSDALKKIPDEKKKLNEDLNKISSQLSPLVEKASGQAGLQEKQAQLAAERLKLQKVEEYQKKIEQTVAAIKESRARMLDSYRKIHDLYLGLVTKLDEKKVNLTDVELNISLRYDATRFEENVSPLIDKRKEQIENILPSYDSSETDKHFEAINHKITSILKREYAFFEKVSPEDALKRFLSDYFKIDYKIKYHSDEFNKMSPGKRSLVLLKLLIELDDSKHPILLDQPEDDLDNRSIYYDLVTFLRAKKKERQIILVTHNPNLVIGTDSEQVVVANQEGQDDQRANRSRRFEYIAGAIENSFEDKGAKGILNQMGIRQHICQILEGGSEAFKKREQRYNIPN